MFLGGYKESVAVRFLGRKTEMSGRREEGKQEIQWENGVQRTKNVVQL